MKKTAVTILKFAVSFGILVLIAFKVDTKELWQILKTAHIGYFIASVLVYYAVQGVSAYRWFLLLKPQGLKTPYSRILSFYFLGMYFNFFLPTAIGGDAVRVYYLHKEEKRLSHSTASVFLDRDLGMAALLIIATVVAAFAGTTIKGIALTPIFVLISLAFLFANLAIFYRPTYNLLHSLLKRTRMKQVDHKVESLFKAVNSYRGHSQLLSVAMLLSFIIQLGGIASNVLLAKAIDFDTLHGWIDFLVFIPAISLISMNPLSVAGTGWREYSYQIFFQSVALGSPALAAEKAIALGLLWLGVMVATSLPGGILYIFQSSTPKAEAETDQDDALTVSDEALEPGKP
ncbi:MAG: flippase-like domain-containing protein [Acidobacteria bacterium]|nr:flippase-like domain-containing protein [Acidobacteriota bacterium]